ncbi:MAG TPA: 3'-5' exonuclease, partial [Chloroflexia bacterium]|nr:3'-5' exonuclease [Chloroflexia bacterium]
LEPAAAAEATENYFQEIAARVYRRYQELLTRNRAVDFDDLIRLPIKLLVEDPAVRDKWQRRFQHILVDEYQDTNHAQYIMVKMLADQHRNLCVVGDPDQSIYGWRQADIQNILNFERDYPDAKVILLEQNYRSTQTILNTAQSVILPNTERKEKNLWTENSKGVPITVYEAYDENDEAGYVAKEISRAVKRGLARWRDFAVMYRMNAQSRAVEQAFLGYNVPYQMVGGVRFYSRKEIKDVLALLRLIQNPFDSVAFARAINNTPLGKGIGAKTLSDLDRAAAARGVPVYTILQLLEEGEQGEGGGPALGVPTARLLPVLRTLNSFIAVREELNLPDLLDKVLDDTRLADFLQDGSDEGLERWQNVMELRTQAGNYAELPPPEGLARFLEDVALISDLDNIQEEKDAVTLITLHAAKGLEFPTVFMVGLEEGLLPHSRSMDSLHELEEERRLAYVGITRAKQQLYLIYAFRRTFYGETRPGTPSRFLHDVPQDLATGLDKIKRAASRGGWTPESMGLGSSGPRRAGGPTTARDPEPTGRVFGASGGRTAARPSGPPSRPGLPPGRGTPPRPVPGPAVPPRPPRPAGSAQWRAGDKARHPTFGEGIVVQSKPTGADEEVTIAFAGHGIKRLLASLANLERI